MEVETFGQEVTADAWSWKFAIEHFRAYTTGTGDPTNITLHGWDVNASGVQALIQFKNFHPITKEEEPKFMSQFHPPSSCPMKCDSLRAAGKLRSYEKAWGLRAAKYWKMH
jgi:hypothetical protein